MIILKTGQSKLYFYSGVELLRSGKSSWDHMKLARIRKTTQF